MHPDVVYQFGSKILDTGYEYLMAATPMPSQYENPCIWGSHDGKDWEVPSGATNPIVPKPTIAANYNSDTDMHVGPDGRLALVYREVAPTPEAEDLYVIYSNDARQWTTPEKFLDITGISGVANRKLMSPAIVWNGAEYQMWTVRELSASPLSRVVDLRRAATLGGLAAAAVESTNLFSPRRLDQSVDVWHLDVILYAGVYYALTFDTSGCLDLFASSDGRGWNIARTNPVRTKTGVSAYSLYRSAMQFDLNGDLTIWLSSQATSTSDTSVIAKVTLPKCVLPIAPPA